MITQVEIDKARQANPQKFAELQAAGFKPQRIVQIIQEQAAEKAQRDKENPPQQAAIQRVQAAQDIVLTHLDRARLSKAELDKLVDEVRAQFPDLQIEIISLDAPGADATHEAKLSEYLAEIEQLKKDKAVQAERIAQLEDTLSERAKDLEAVQKAHDAAAVERDALHAEKSVLENKIKEALALKSLKAAHEALS